MALHHNIQAQKSISATSFPKMCPFWIRFLLFFIRKFVIFIFSSRKPYLQPRSPFCSKSLSRNAIWYVYLRTPTMIFIFYERSLKSKNKFARNKISSVYCEHFSANMTFQMDTNLTLSSYLSYFFLHLNLAMSSRVNLSQNYFFSNRAFLIFIC